MVETFDKTVAELEAQYTLIRDGHEGLRDLALHLSGRVSRCAYACYEVEHTGETAKSANAKLQTVYVIEIANMILKRIAEVESAARSAHQKRGDNG